MIQLNSLSRWIVNDRLNVAYWHKCEVQRCPLFGRYHGKNGRRGHRVFVDAEVKRGGPGGARQRSLASRPRFRAVAVSSTLSPHTIRGRCYCVRNLYATIRATMLAKISSAGRDFRIIGLVEWRAADGPG